MCVGCRAYERHLVEEHLLSAERAQRITRAALTTPLAASEPPPELVRPPRPLASKQERDAAWHRAIQTALEAAGGNRTTAARALGVSVRTVRNWANRS